MVAPQQHSDRVVASAILDRLAASVRAALPAVNAALPHDPITEADLEGFLDRNRAGLLAAVTPLVPLLGRMVAPASPAPTPASAIGEVPEQWTPGQRTKANLAALQVLAKLAPGQRPTTAQATTLAQYSGWGALSIKKVQAQFPKELPPPEDFGLIHEYYTPARVWSEVADALKMFRKNLSPGGGIFRALEPSAGIGRALRAMQGFSAPVHWTAVEYSALSSRMLAALFPEAAVTHSSFEAWVAEHDHERFDLILSNPPYGQRDEATSEDPRADEYRASKAYHYFLIRSLDLLRPGGIGVYVIPTGLLDAPSYAPLRERILKRHHLHAAFRLPSQAPQGADQQSSVAYDKMPVDVLFFEARGGTLPAVPTADQGILAGDYFTEHPSHLLGKPVGKLTEGWDPSQPVGRRGYQVVGRFTRLPPFRPRPLDREGLAPDEPPQKAERHKVRGGIAARVIEAKGEVSAEAEAAITLGLRADAFLAAVARQDPAAAAGWAELHRDLTAWREQYGEPARHRELQILASQKVTGAVRFLALWRGSTLIEALQTEPTIELRYQGDWNLPAVADWLYRQRAGRLTVKGLVAFYGQHKQPLPHRRDIEARLLPAGWFLDGEGWDELVPERDYLTGFLWPRYDRAAARTDIIAQAQAKRLREVIGWRSGPDLLKECSPIDAWLPLDVVTRFINETMQNAQTGAKPIAGLVREDGILRVEGVPYARLVNTDKNRTPGMSRRFLTFLGWANQDKALQSPVRADVFSEDGEKTKEKKSAAMDREITEMAEGWRDWFRDNPDQIDSLEQVYNRQMRGYVPPEYSDEPMPCARWSNAITPHGYQNRAVRRLVENRSGILAFDTGLGKTYSGIAMLAQARQQGWAKRPVVLVPNSIVWKWYRDIQRCLPDYRVCVIGSNREMATRGKNKGRMVAERDSSRERGEKWTAFQAGQYDVVLLTYTALSRTQMDAAFLQNYVQNTIAIRRSIAMEVDKDKDAKGGASDPAAKAKAPTERREAEIKARAKKWLAEVLSPPKGWSYDEGIDWHKLGVDLLIVDEAQNFKNLFHSSRNGEKTDTKRSWALDFRCASVRAHSGGAGIVLLSATPAKNDPVEFYNLLHYLHPEVWQQVAIDNHESFLNRFGEYEKKIVPNASGTELEEKEVMVRFKNLDELRSVVYRWCEFKVAEDVGLKIPEAVRHTHYVELTAGQIRPIAEAVSELVEVEEKLSKMAQMGNKDDEKSRAIMQALKQKKQGLSLRIYLTSLHPDLPGIGDNERAVAAADLTDAPKLQACAKVIKRTSNMVCRDDTDCLDCGHIIFVENTAVHTWMKKILVAQGIPAERIAILNAKEAADTELRQQISEGFNGTGNPGEEEHELPRYDIVIANAIAYEGMDLQRRTCAIHHLDVPWDPSTLQQRNGRGVRQGNRFAVVEIHYYFVQGSNELNRVERIERKRGWMASLVSSQARATNTTLNEGEDEGTGDIEELAMRYASAETRAKMLEQREARQKREETERAERIRKQANRELRDIDDLFRRADRESDPALAGELRAEADEALEALLKRIPTGLYADAPWHDHARRVRETSLFIPEQGLPLMPGDALGVVRWGTAQPYLLTSLGLDAEGKERGAWFRARHEVRPTVFYSTKTDLSAEGFTVPMAWPEEDPAALQADGIKHFAEYLYRLSDWPERNWSRVSTDLRETLWPDIEATLRQKGKIHLDGYLYGDTSRIRVPLDVGGSLAMLAKGNPEAGVERLPNGARLIPPTDAGWSRFLALARQQGGKDALSWTALDLAARFWWDRRFPRGFFKDEVSP